MTQQPGSPAPSTAAGPSRRRRPSDALAWLGGADREILELARSGRNQFIQMGLVVLATAGVAVLSMAFALHTGLHVGTRAAIAGGIMWGCVIAIIDRFLITTLDLRSGLGRVAFIIGVRVLIAALLGFVISTPLVLQVFQREIKAEIVQSNTAAGKSFGDALNATPIATELARVRKNISADEAVLRGDVPAASSTEVAARTDDVTRTQAELTRLQAISDRKYRAWQCELYGSSCEGSTREAGNGSLSRAREKEYRDALAQTEAAQTAVRTAQGQLAAAQKAASQQGGAAVKHAQDVARAELPGLHKREAELQASYNNAVDVGNSTSRDNDGLLAQIVALDHLGARNGEARIAHLAVAGLFFLIELLPVLVKILSSLGSPSAYERVRELTENAKVDDAKIDNRRRTRERDDEEVRIAKEAKKSSDVEDDMRVRERDLGIKANARVAVEMEKVLDVALAQWSHQVQRTLHGAATAFHNGNGNGNGNGQASVAGSGTSGSAAPTVIPANGVAAPAVVPMNGVAPSLRPAPSGPVQPAATTQATQSVRSTFNLPPANNLGPATGGTP